MKRISLFFVCIFFAIGSVCAAGNSADTVSTNHAITSIVINPEKEDAINSIVKIVKGAHYKGIDHDGVYTMTAENVVVYSSELNKYLPFKTFVNPTVSSYYILNVASRESNLEPVYSYDGEKNPENWPEGLNSSDFDIDAKANGYRRSGNRGLNSTTDTVTYLDAEEQRKFEERTAAEKAAGKIKLTETLNKYFDSLKNSDYSVFYDAYKNVDFLMSVRQIEIYSKDFNNLLSPSFKTDSAVRYVLNKASVAHGYEPVYSVNKETDPDKWNLPRYRTINESATANGYRVAEIYHKKILGLENTATAYIIVRYDSADAAKLKAEKVAAGKAYLDSIGLGFEENKTQKIKIIDKELGNITTDVENYRVFTMTVEKKSAAQKSGLKSGDLFIVANGKLKNGKSTAPLTTKIRIGTRIFDLSYYGCHADVDAICLAFADVDESKKVEIQVVRGLKTSPTFIRIAK